MSNEIMRKLADAYKKVNESKFIIPEDIPVDERDMFMAKAAAAHKAGQSHFTMNGKKHPVTMKKDTANAVNSSTNEAKDLDKTNADKAIQHDCATHVEHSKWGKGNPISGMHTIVETSPGQGYVTHYDIVFEHGIEKNVSVDDLTILSEMSHGHSRKKKSEMATPVSDNDPRYADDENLPKNKKKKMEMSSKEKMKRGLYNSKDAEVKENQKAALAKKLAKVSAPSAKGKAAVTLPPGDPTKKKMEQDEVEMNPKMKKDKTKSAENDSMAESVYARILEARATADKGGHHYKGATPPEEMDSKDSGLAKKMRKDHEPEMKDNPEESGNDMTKAQNAAKVAPKRKGDNAKGDTKVIPSATPAKG